MNTAKVVKFSDTSMPLNDLIEKLSGKDGEIWLNALQKMLLKENYWTARNRWDIWKTIKTIPIKSPDDFYRLIEEKKDYGLCYGREVRRSLEELSPWHLFSKEDQEIDLVCVNLDSLNFGRYGKPTLKGIYEKAEELGLKLCPPSLPLSLRLSLTDNLPQDRRYGECPNPLIATKPLELMIENSRINAFEKSDSAFFFLETSGGIAIRQINMEEEVPWPRDYHMSIIFMLDK